jgi:hypothetical protein
MSSKLSTGIKVDTCVTKVFSASTCSHDSKKNIPHCLINYFCLYFIKQNLHNTKKGVFIMHFANDKRTKYTTL